MDNKYEAIKNQDPSECANIQFSMACWMTVLRFYSILTTAYKNFPF